MKKIMFNDRYGLTEAVLKGHKTQTRRILTTAYDRFELGEIVAIAMPYKDILNYMIKKKGGYGEEEAAFEEKYSKTKGWNNKMFVRADLMLNRIHITQIKHERLQHISEADCIAEGIFRIADLWRPKGDQIYYEYFGSTKPFGSPYKAFADLIDRISGKGTWDANPLVSAYSFELVK